MTGILQIADCGLRIYEELPSLSLSINHQPSTINHQPSTTQIAAE